ncbi:hypothetical protein CcaverHIS002_0305220 [Cutaneotrichosporon cavernicola]|uniref:Uncharacterized protein n=1 Tax=Cutaneotrichosporon cavernicola TaxID=279322 RepID=A0AA48I691_9TREE|nr:uncharacterized protein CcaverHIS019_0305190 [Cutaneotrichosporon cavernicola]BEI82654.1 hypothetical protein CcaverHIS002_0305220 [Cutaneotrichosporon cavernicola]BEI90449.1 hypothetical protein CcaverHIS019_0305190 [Cutaneotrichosporon cavernicola]BEI98223.1 hypothetical protein CcaverHIS631_0305220 [Cutaneotrichosporon cavernicola]BEJ05999.1 hypothetical protein CcaverHIS641_0305210 [Cutaneotrichosporon cavernicola]
MVTIRRARVGLLGAPKRRLVTSTTTELAGAGPGRKPATLADAATSTTSRSLFNSNAPTISIKNPPSIINALAAVNLPGPTLNILADTATASQPHRTEGFPWGHSTTRPGVIAGATVGSVLGAAIIALVYLCYARRMAWCFVHKGPRAHTPLERFEAAELGRPASVIPHFHPSADALHELSPIEANGEMSGYPHTYLNVPPHLHESPTPPGTPETPATYITCRSDPWAIPWGEPARASTPPPLRPEVDENGTVLSVGHDGADSVTRPPRYSPTLVVPQPQYYTTTQRLGSRSLSLSDKATEMGLESPDQLQLAHK